jgi:hypothetical protein
MKYAIKNDKTEALAQRIANAILAENAADYKEAMVEFKALPLVLWDALAIKDRVHYLVKSNPNYKPTGAIKV